MTGELRRLHRSRSCRWCRQPTWMSDQDGPTHPCCTIHMGEQGLPRCPACGASHALRAQDRRRAKASQITEDLMTQVSVRNPFREVPRNPREPPRGK